MFKMKSDILIKSIDIYILKIPLNKPIKMAGISVDSAENLFVKITNQNDNYGWGEASSAPTMTGEFSQGMFAAATFLKNILVNKKSKHYRWHNFKTILISYFQIKNAY